MVDAIKDQRQVVIKSLETNFQQIPGVAGATILGDGRVALILDVETIVAYELGRARLAEAARTPLIPSSNLSTASTTSSLPGTIFQRWRTCSMPGREFS